MPETDVVLSAVDAPTFFDDPFPAYRLMREAGLWRSPSGKVVVSTYADLTTVLRDSSTYVMQPGAWPNFHRSNAPDHTRIRRLVSRAFAPRSISVKEERIVQIVNELVDRHISAGGMELMNDFAKPIPNIVTAEMLGVPLEDVELWWSWLDEMGEFTYLEPFHNYEPVSQQPLIERAQGAMAAAAEYFGRVMKMKRDEPDGGLVAALGIARDGKDQLTDDEALYCP